MQSLEDYASSYKQNRWPVVWILLSVSEISNPAHILFLMPKKMYHFIHLQDKKVSQKHCIPNNRICNATKDKKENFCWLFRKFLLSEVQQGKKLP